MNDERPRARAKPRGGKTGKKRPMFTKLIRLLAAIGDRAFTSAERQAVASSARAVIASHHPSDRHLLAASATVRALLGDYARLDGEKKETST